jgi:hypothetical protein
MIVSICVIEILRCAKQNNIQTYIKFSMISITQLKGRFSSCLCIWFQRNKKIYIIESNDDDSDSDNDNDWDKGDLINGNKQVQHRYRRQGILCIFKPVGP